MGLGHDGDQIFGLKKPAKDLKVGWVKNANPSKSRKNAAIRYNIGAKNNAQRKRIRNNKYNALASMNSDLDSSGNILYTIEYIKKNLTLPTLSSAPYLQGKIFYKNNPKNVDPCALVKGSDVHITMVLKPHNVPKARYQCTLACTLRSSDVIEAIGHGLNRVSLVLERQRSRLIIAGSSKNCSNSTFDPHPIRMWRTAGRL